MLIDRLEQTCKPLGFELQHLAVPLQRADLVEVRIFDDGPDLFEREAQLPEEQDLLEPQQVVLRRKAGSPPPFWPKGVASPNSS